MKLIRGGLVVSGLWAGGYAYYISKITADVEAVPATAVSAYCRAKGLHSSTEEHMWPSVQAYRSRASLPSNEAVDDVFGGRYLNNNAAHLQSDGKKAAALMSMLHPSQRDEMGAHYALHALSSTSPLRRHRAWGVLGETYRLSDVYHFLQQHSVGFFRRVRSGAAREEGVEVKHVRVCRSSELKKIVLGEHGCDAAIIPKKREAVLAVSRRFLFGVSLSEQTDQEHNPRALHLNLYSVVEKPQQVRLPKMLPEQLATQAEMLVERAQYWALDWYTKWLAANVAKSLQHL